MMLHLSLRPVFVPHLGKLTKGKFLVGFLKGGGKVVYASLCANADSKIATKTMVLGSMRHNEAL